MNGKGLKRPLPMPRTTAAPWSSSSVRPGDGLRIIDETPRSRKNRRNRGNPPGNGRGTGVRGGGRCHCCGYKRSTGSTLRLARIVGIHVLGFMACPCRGFAPSGAGMGMLPDRQRTGDGEHGRVLGADNSVCRAEDRFFWSSSSGVVAARPAAVRSRRRRPRDGRGVGSDGAGVTVCHATRLPSAEEGRPLGLLYDRGLLRAGVAVTETSSSRSGDSPASGAGTAATATAATAAAAEAATSEGEQSETVVVETEGSFERDSPAKNLAENLTTRWASVVNGALAGTTSLEPQQQQQALSGVGEATAAASGIRRKWSGKGWLGIGASWRAGEGWAGPREMETATAAEAAAAAAAAAASAAANQASTRTTTPPRPDPENDPAREVLLTVGIDCRYGGNTTVELPANATSASVPDRVAVEATEVATLTTEPEANLAERPSWRVWQGPERRRPGELVGKDVCAMAREELTLRLLETGATHYEVARASAALFAMEPDLALTGVTWRRWRQNLDGLRLTGFTGGMCMCLVCVDGDLIARHLDAVVLRRG